MTRIFGKCAGLAIASSLLVFGSVSADTLLSDDFESGSLDKWTMAVDKAEIVETVVHAGRRALHIPYEVPAGEPEHKDNNRFVQVDLSKYGLNQFYVNGCFYLASTSTPVGMRKLYYIWSNPRQSPEWNLILNVYGGDGKPLDLGLLSNAYSYSDLRVPKRIGSGKIQYNKWHCISLEIKLNTPGQKNGSARLVLDGVTELALSNISIRADSKPLGLVRIGAQVDRNYTTERTYEDRYWDDIEIGSASGSGTSIARPNPPTDVTATEQ